MKNKNIKVKFGLNMKLFLLVLVSFGILMTAIYWRLNTEAEHAAKETIERSLNQSRIILKSSLETQFEKINDMANSIASDGRILPHVFEKDSVTLMDLSSEFENVMHFTTLIFTDEDGVIIARSDRPDAIGRSMKGRSFLFDSALSGKKAQGFMISKGKLLQIVAIPVYDNIATEILKGTLALSFELSPQIAKEIYTLTESEIGFYVFSGKQKQLAPPVMQYMTNQERGALLNVYLANYPEVWKNIINKTQKTLKAKFSNHQIYQSVIIPLERSGGGVLGFVIAMRSQTELMRPFISIQQQVLMVSVICLIFASIIAWGIARRISKPIIELAMATRNIAEGLFDEKLPYYIKQDEVGVLYQTIWQMRRSLKEKAELENYLANLTRDIEVDQSLVESFEEKKDDLREMQVYKSMINHHVSEEIIEQLKRQIIIGENFSGRYKVMKILGFGAVGIVYLAQDIELDEKVAIKVIFDSHMEGEVLDLYKREIKLARKITHPNVLRTFDFGNSSQFYYISMEYVYGYNLFELIHQKGALNTSISLTLVRQICSAVAAAHDKGIIHRDLKPQNMIINRQGVLKIMDFGLAVQLTNQPAKLNGDAAQGISSMAMGTPLYMAPEQFLNESTDERTDIYAIGIIFFNMITGHLPFHGITLADIAKDHLYSPVPSVQTYNKEISAKLDLILAKAMAKSREDRYASVNELRVAFEKFTDN